jgi:hypothetical protein
MFSFTEELGEIVGLKQVIGDYTSKKVWHVMSPSALSPNGHCNSEAMAEDGLFIKAGNATLVSSAQFLAFKKENGETAAHVPDSQLLIRCGLGCIYQHAGACRVCAGPLYVGYVAGVRSLCIEFSCPALCTLNKRVPPMRFGHKRMQEDICDSLSAWGAGVFPQINSCTKRR